MSFQLKAHSPPLSVNSVPDQTHQPSATKDEPSPNPRPPPPSPSTHVLQKRPFCSRCARPQRVCLCSILPRTPISTPTSIIIFQTLSESKAKVRTADLVPLILRHARLLSADHDFEAHIPPSSILLFPSCSAVPLHSLPAAGRTLVLLDATWDKAQRLLNKSEALQRMPRAFVAEELLGIPLFRARKPPTKSIAGARSTAEAVAGALQCVDGKSSAEAVAALRACVHEASEMQLRFVRSNGDGQGRHRKERKGYEEGWYSVEYARVVSNM